MTFVNFAVETYRPLGNESGTNTTKSIRCIRTEPPTTGKRKLPSRSSGPSPSKPRSYGMPCQRRHKEDQFWHPSHSDPPPTNYTPGILTILKGALKKSHAENNTARAVLCYERTTHISRELFDSGWGCGYRNFLMACAALMDQKIQPLYFCHLDAPLPPGVWNLQQWIEDAWKQGYDEIGAKELGHQLVGTKKFIGTGDIYVAFISRGISCRLVDFDLKRSTKGPRALTDWVVQYFSDPARKQGSVHDVLRNASPVVATDKMPVILQYRGHSVTIIGFEVARSGEINLLVFDPSHIFAKKIRSAALTDPQNVTFTSSKLSKTLRVGQQKSRSRSKSPVSRKRTRLGPDLEGPIVISDSEDDEEGHDPASHCTLCAGDVIKIFRWKMSKLESVFRKLLHEISYSCWH
ncbi:peptidase family C78-domain-containing protein [Scleroderma yunnanense]